MHSLHFKFEGDEADRHRLPMRHLGAALVGIDGIVNQGLFVFAYGRPAPKRRRFELQLSTEEPKSGSVEIIAILKDSQWVLPLLRDFVVSGGIEISKHFLSYVLLRFGGRPTEANKHMEALLQMNRDHLDARNQNDEQWRQTFLAVVDRLAPQAKQVVAPVGNGAGTLQLIDGVSPSLVVDEPMADAIRARQGDQVGDMTSIEIQVDGVIHHSRQLKIQHPDGEGRFITAEIRDPLFTELPNPYAEAAAAMSSIRVMAKPVYRNGELFKLYVMDIARDQGGARQS
ncbi:hypothetical protein [Ciceribacter selenitireducens]|uniref:DUF7946 domain-containing protein n=1 Tax=Ciceribacter selenitireducens TaxID=448181 RepID=UPI0011C06FE7|nr:hypothetical protein [Ciceribacter selenitireducens]